MQFIPGLGYVSDSGFVPGGGYVVVEPTVTTVYNVKHYNGSSFVPAIVKRFNGSTWDEVVVKRFNGATWDTIQG